MMRGTVFALVLLGALVETDGSVFASPAAEEGRVPASRPVSTSIVVDPFFERVVEDLLASSATLRDQYERIASAPRVLVRVQPLYGGPRDRAARATISRSVSGLLLARVEVATPLRAVEFAEMLAHEFEHILEQIEGVELSDAADRRSGGVARLVDGSYETDRARRVGRAAALEFERNAQVAASK